MKSNINNFTTAAITHSQKRRSIFSTNKRDTKVEMDLVVFNRYPAACCRYMHKSVQLYHHAYMNITNLWKYFQAPSWI